MEEIGATIRAKLVGFVEHDAGNAMPAHGGMRIYDAPLVGFAAADDALFDALEAPEVFGPQGVKPRQWLPGARSVVSYYLPYTKEIRDTNHGLPLPSEEWCSARIDGEAFNISVRRYLEELLRELGGEAVAPPLDPRFSVRKLHPDCCKISNWSERHAAHIAGLGTFGLHRALITEKGSAGRIGSAVTTLEIAPTPRAYSGPFDYCPYLTKGKCGVCMKRCPGDAFVDGEKTTFYAENSWISRKNCSNRAMAAPNATSPCPARRGFRISSKGRARPRSRPAEAPTRY